MNKCSDWVLMKKNIYISFIFPTYSYGGNSSFHREKSEYLFYFVQLYFHFIIICHISKKADKQKGIKGFTLLGLSPLEWSDHTKSKAHFLGSRPNWINRDPANLSWYDVELSSLLYWALGPLELSHCWS